MEKAFQREIRRRQFDLLLPSTQRALCRNGIWDDTAVAPLTNRDLLRPACIGPVGREDIRRALFPYLIRRVPAGTTITQRERPFVLFVTAQRGGSDGQS